MAMPPHDSVGLDDKQGAAPVPPGFREQNPKESITRSKLRAFCSARECSQLLTEPEVLECDGSASAADQSDRSENDDQRCQHVSSWRAVERKSIGGQRDQVLAKHKSRPGIPEPPHERLTPSASGHRIRDRHRVVAEPILGGLHQEYRLEPMAA